MVSDRFRQQLRDQAAQWQVEGLIDAEQYQQLADRYQFEQLERVARDRFIVILIGLGSILLGIGALTFVAANWQVVSREAKIGLLLALFIGINIMGFSLWKHPLDASEGVERWQQRLGQGLLLLGAMILGANMALMGQLFHSSGTASEWCLVWSLGVVAMAYSLRLTALGVLAVVVMGVGYWLGIQQLSSIAVLSNLTGMLQYMPVLAGLLFLPLAYWCQSNTIFVLTAIAVISSFEVGLTDLGRLFGDAPGLIVAIAFALPLALLWSYDDAIWWGWRQPGLMAQPFRSLSRALALVYLTVLSYFLSFHGLWTELDNLPSFSRQITTLFTTGLPFLFNLNLWILLGVTFVGWWGLTRSPRRWRLDLIDSVMLGFVGLIALLPLWHWSISPIQPLATFLFNVLLFLLAAGFLREGIAEGQRTLFWSGMVLLTLQILSRTIEYDTGLLFKSLVFLLCGVGVIVIGLWFERYVRSLNRAAPHRPVTSHPELP